jgi:hypothetical protein
MDVDGEFEKKRHRAGCIESLSYHKYWDDLIPVVKKCLYHAHAHDNTYREDIRRELLCLNITMLYKAVVLFITELNELDSDGFKDSDRP